MVQILTGLLPTPPAGEETTDQEVSKNRIVTFCEGEEDDVEMDSLECDDPRIPIVIQELIDILMLLL